MTRGLVLALAAAAASVLWSTSPVSADVETTEETHADLTIRRMAPSTAFVGQRVWVTITVENKGTDQKSIALVEQLGDADFDKSEAEFIEIRDPGPQPTQPDQAEKDDAPRLWYYRWRMELPPGESATVAYWIVGRNPGYYVIPPAEVTVAEEIFRLKSVDIRVGCRADGECDIRGGENYATCPQDCSTGAADNVCDFAVDGRCDPDCEIEADPDCAQGGDNGGSRDLYLLLGIPLGAVALFLLGAGLLVNRRRRKRHA